MADNDGLIGFLNLSDLSSFTPVIDASLQPQNEADLDDSNTYRWNGSSLKLRVGEVLPIVYGRHPMSPTLINAFIEEGENETLNMLMAWCEGEIESITNLKINGTPIEDIFAQSPVDPFGEAAEVSHRLGKVNQTSIDGFDDLHNPVPVGTTLQKNESIIFEGTVDDTRFIIIEYEITKLFRKDVVTEAISSRNVSVRVEIKRAEDQIFEFLTFLEFNKRTTAPFKRFFRSELLDTNRYDIRITKVSDNPDNLSTFGDIRVLSVDMVQVEEGGLTYPSTGVTGLRMLAFQDLKGNVPNITGLITGTKISIPKVTFSDGGDDLVDWELYYYDPSTARYRLISNDSGLFWDDVSFVTEWSANPAWCLRDILLNPRYGLGDDIGVDKVNETSFLVASQYYEEKVLNEDGNPEKRFRLDLVIDKDSPATDIIALILKTARGILFQSEKVLRLEVEREQNPKAMFNMGNIVAGSFSLQYVKKKIPNVMAVDFTNENKNYLRDRVEVGDPEQAEIGARMRTQTQRMFGVTRVGQVLRETRILLSKLKNNRRIINFAAFFDAILLQPFDVISFQHDMPGWGSGGRVENFCTTTEIKVDAEVIIQPGSVYEIQVRNPLTDVFETRAVSNVPGVFKTITVSVPFTFLPRKNDIWTVGIVDVDIQKYRITRISRAESGKVSITAVEHNDDVYDPTGIIVPEDIYTHLILDIPKVQNLTLSEVFNRLPNGTIENKIQVSFQFAPVVSKFVKQANSYEIWLSDNDGASWNLITKTDKEFFTIPELVQKGLIYTVAIVSIAETGEKNPIAVSPQQTISIQGSVRPPTNVQNLTFDFTDEITLKWDKNPETDIQGYEIRIRDDGWLSESDSLIWRGDATSFVIVRPTARDGVRFYVRAFNTSGVISDDSAQITPVNPAPGSPDIFLTAFFQKVFITWFRVADADVVEYQVWENDEINFTGDEVNEERIIGTVTGTSFVAAITFPDTFYRVVAIDRFGRGAFSVILKASSAQIILGEIGDNAVSGDAIIDESITAFKIAAGAITADKIEAKAVRADKIDVADLSAISADLGTVRAGTLIGASIKTSEDDFRIELDDVGFRAFDCNGVLTVKIQQGELCMIDPLCDECYSFLDAGGLFFHTPFGDLPYATRICSGVETAGGTVKLEQWKGRPEVIIGIKRLTSYDATKSESSQEWCVFADNIRSYDFGGSNFGWCFDVRSKLVVSGGSRGFAEFNAPFNSIRCTGSGTCEAIVAVELQLFQHGAAPAVFQYGCLCYQIQFRKLGSPSFCAFQFDYLQPHETKQEMQTTNLLCHTVIFGSNATWEVRLIETGRQFVNSNIRSGGFICVFCCEVICDDRSFFTSAVITKTVGFGASASTTAVFKTTTVRNEAFVDFGIQTIVICNSIVAYIGSGRISAREGIFGANANAAVIAEFGGGASRTGSRRGSFGVAFTFRGGTTRGSYIQGFKITATASAWARSFKGFESASISGNIRATNTVCFKRCVINEQIIRRLCCIFVGAANSNDTRKFRAMADVTGVQDVRDAFGEINWLAVAYR